MTCGTIIATIDHKRGETVAFGLRSDPPYDGTEVVTCDVKKQTTRGRIPPESEPVVYATSPQFVPEYGDTAAHWMFTIPAAETAGMAAGDYVTDAKVIYHNGQVDYPEALGICLSERVTV